MIYIYIYIYTRVVLCISMHVKRQWPGLGIEGLGSFKSFWEDSRGYWVGNPMKQ